MHSSDNCFQENIHVSQTKRTQRETTNLPAPDRAFLKRSGTRRAICSSAGGDDRGLGEQSAVEGRRASVHGRGCAALARLDPYRAHASAHGGRTLVGTSAN